MKWAQITEGVGWARHHCMHASGCTRVFLFLLLLQLPDVHEGRLITEGLNRPIIVKACVE